MRKITIIIISILAITHIANSQNCTNCDANNTIIPENYSSALGIENTSTGQASFASGKLNTASNMYSTAFGYNNLASGQVSFAAGGYVSATGVYSIGIGDYLKASGSNSMVIGTGGGTSNLLTNSNSNSLMIGFGSTKPTLFVNTASASDKTGTIGIGDVTSPAAKLRIKTDSGEESAMFIEPWTWNSNQWSEIRIGTQNHAVRVSANYGIEFKTESNYIFNSQNARVGIGTNSPSEKLEVNGTVKATAFSGDGSGLTNVPGSNYWVLNGNDMYNSNNGNIGIGKTDPNTTLDVTGDVKLTGMLAVGNMPYPSYKLHVKGNSDDWAAVIENTYMTGNGLKIKGAHSTYPNKPILQLTDQSNNVKFIVTTGGKVGIGVSGIPSEALDVNGNANINGEIVCGGIEVTDITEWKDYVFEPDYDLPGLSEVEAFIIEHKHLPGIPSGKEVMGNGINLAEMNALLLQKIEELTLYVIRQEKEINNLKEKIYD
ncbi:MAG: hypothetical protein R2764_24660 [Bacteroidales bacterium]